MRGALLFAGISSVDGDAGIFLLFIKVSYRRYILALPVRNWRTESCKYGNRQPYLATQAAVVYVAGRVKYSAGSNLYLFDR